MGRDVRFAAAIATVAAALAAPAVASAYGWPLKPFDQQHPIRGYFDDPRIDADGGQYSFHFGVDISAPDGTTVYAVRAGTVYLHGNSVAILEPNHHVFSYWHVIPTVKEHAHVRVHDPIGKIVRSYLHVHFAERVNGVYVNPLRPGGLSPYRDTTRPTIAGIGFYRGRKRLSTAELSGTVSVILDAWDTPALRPPPPWDKARVAPALIRWRLLRKGGPVVRPWRIAVDFRSFLLPQPRFHRIYAPRTAENLANRPARLLFYLSPSFRTLGLADGQYQLEVQAEDTRGNRADSTFGVGVANHRHKR